MNLHVSTVSGCKVKGVAAGFVELGIDGANWNRHIYGESKTPPSPSALERSTYTRRGHIAGMHAVNFGTSPGSLN